MSTNLYDSPPRTSGKTSIGFQDGFYYNRFIKHYKECIQVPFQPGNIKNKSEIRIKLETDESGICNPNPVGITIIETLTNQGWGRKSNSTYTCCEGPNHSTKEINNKINQRFTRETCLRKGLVRSCNSSSFKRNMSNFTTLHFYKPERDLWGKYG